MHPSVQLKTMYPIFFLALFFAQATKPLLYASARFEGLIIVDAADIRCPVNPMIFGQNIMAANAKDIFSRTTNHYMPSAEGIWDIQERRPNAEMVNISKAIGMKSLRYPGGCYVHGFDWRETVGSYNDRPDFAYGLDEHIEYCKTVGAEPVITVSDYTGTAHDKADLVEYLNAPAASDHPWAMKRAQWGHPAPYQVTYFEIGNESYHGNHRINPFKRFSAEEYAQYFRDCAARMKHIDPSVKLGAVLINETGPSAEWNQVVYTTTLPLADYFIVHTYYKPIDNFMVNALFAEDLIAGYRMAIRKYCGKDIPLAITEYNTGAAEAATSYGASFFIADYIRAMLEPQNNVLMAHYFTWLGVPFGFINNGKNKEKIGAAYTIFKMWQEHFGHSLVGMDLQSPIAPAKLSKPIEEAVCIIQSKQTSEYRVRVMDKSTFAVDVTGAKKDTYPELGYAAISPASSYEISFQARLIGDPSGFSFGLGVMDRRGWHATKSAISIEGAEKKTDWFEFKAQYITLNDASEIAILARVRGDSPGVNATMEVKDLQIKRRPEIIYKLLSSIASLSKDGKTVYLVLFNRSATDSIPVNVSLASFPFTEAKRWTLNTSGTLENNYGGNRVQETVKAQPMTAIKNAVSFDAPAHSISFLECYKQ